MRAAVPAALVCSLLALACADGDGGAVTEELSRPPTGKATATVTPHPTEVPPLTRTELRVVQPFQGSELNPALTVVGELTGDCWTGSLANGGRPDAWRCSADSQIIDPCFASNFGDAVLACPRLPWTGEVRILRLTAPLPREMGNRANDAAPPWALELVPGTRCGFITGGTGTVAGERLNYGCDDGGVVYGQPDRTRPVWTVLYQPEGSAELIETEVRTAWR